MRNITVGLSLVILLLLSITVGNIHIHENERLNLILSDKEEIIKQQIITEDVLRKEIDKLKQINTSQNEELEKKNQQLELLHKEIEKLKKEKSPTVSVMPSRGEQSKRKSYVYQITGYTAGVESTGKSPSHPAYGLTASGTRVQEGRTIACPPSLKFGTKVHIENVGYRICEDRGQAVVEGVIDVYFKNVNTALDFGRQKLEVKIYK